MKSYAELQEITNWYRGIPPDSEEWSYATGYAIALLLWMRTEEAAKAEGIEFPPPKPAKPDWIDAILDKMSKIGDAAADASKIAESQKGDKK